MNEKIGVGIPDPLPPEQAAVVASLTAELADLMNIPASVRVTTHKPTEHEIQLHRIRTGQAYFGAAPHGIEPIFRPHFVRWVKPEPAPDLVVVDLDAK